MREFLIGSQLLSTTDHTATPNEPSIEVHCDNSGNVIITRRGLVGILTTGAVSAKVEVRGDRITILERTVTGNDISNTTFANEALFTLDFLAPQRYYIRYETDTHVATTSFRNTPGYHATPSPLNLNS